MNDSVTYSLPTDGEASPQPCCETPPGGIRGISHIKRPPARVRAGLAWGLPAVALLFSLIAASQARGAVGASPSMAGCSNLITNGGFETGGFSGWGTIGAPWISGSLARYGTYSAVVGGDNWADDTFYQFVTLPANADSATLTFWWYMYSEEGIGSPSDYLFVQAQDEGGTPIEDLITLNDQGAKGSWRQTTIDLMNYDWLFGPTIRIAFRGVTDGADMTSFNIDGVQLNLCAEPTPTATAACAIDGWEPNNTFAAARAMDVGISYYGIYLCPSGDEDWFRFDVAAGERMTVDLYSLPADYDLYVHDPDNIVVGTSANGGAADEQVVHTALKTGAYRARIVGYLGASHPTDDCALRVELAEPTATPTRTRTASRTPTTTPTHTPTASPTPTSTPTATHTASPTVTGTWTPPTSPTPTPTPTSDCAYDGWEPNGSFDGAPIMSVGVAHDGIFICPSGDEDWFRFDVWAGQQIQVDLTNLPADYDLFVYDPEGAIVGMSRESGTTAEQVVHTATMVGAYRARLLGHEGAWHATNGCTLRVTLSDVPTATWTPTPTPTATQLYPGCPDAFEPNNVLGGPAWSILDSPRPSYICATDDVDYWKIPSVPVDWSIQVSLTDLPKDYTLVLYNPWNDLSGYSDNWGLADEMILQTADKAGDWHAAVVGKGSYDVSHPYTIGARLFNCPLDDEEPNEHAYDARKMDPLPGSWERRLGLSICPAGDEDWFWIYVPAWSRVLASVDFQANASDGPVQLCLIDSDQSTELSCTRHDLGLNDIDLLLTSDGMRYLRVRSAGTPNTNSDYDLSAMRSWPTVVWTPTATGTPTPTPTPTATLVPTDLTIDGLEVTQAVQGYPNPYIDLVARKTTWARLYVRSSLQDVQGVTARLRLTGGSPQQTAVVYPANGPIRARTGGSQRAQKDDTLNFLIPPPFNQPGVLRIQVELNYDRTLPESNYANNLRVDYHTFYERQEVRVMIWRVRYHISVNPPKITPTVTPTVLVPTRDEGPKATDSLKRLYPVPGVSYTMPIVNDTYDFYGDLSTRGGWELLLWQTLLKWTFSGLSWDIHWYGVVPQLSSALCGDIGGIAYYHSHVAVGFGGANDTMAHELGHNYGLPHAPCGPVADSDPQFPDPTGHTGEFGFDPVTQQVYDPASRYDFMTYCDPAWIHPYNYANLYRAVGGPSLAAETVSEDRNYLLVAGVIDKEAHTGQLGQAYVDARPVGTADQAGEGSYCLKTQNEQSTALFTRCFDPKIAGLGGEADATVRWLEVLPYDADTRRIVLLYQGQELDSRPVSAHEPQVTLDYPNGGQALTGPFEARWHADDADGDALVYTVQYSIDGGETWTAAAIDLTEARYSMDAAAMAGTTQGKLRVLASDGLNTGADESDGVFSVPNKPPEAFIFFPEAGTILSPDEMVLLTGGASDREDGPLEGAALSWRSDRDGALGSGEEVLVQALSAGWHILTLAAVDSAGLTTTDSVAVYVGHRSQLPLLLR